MSKWMMWDEKARLLKSKRKKDLEILSYIAIIYKTNGKQEQKPNELIEIAKIQNLENSNAIKGIKTRNTRLKQLVKEKTTPRN